MKYVSIYLVVALAISLRTVYAFNMLFSVGHGSKKLALVNKEIRAAPVQLSTTAETVLPKPAHLNTRNAFRTLCSVGITAALSIGSFTLFDSPVWAATGTAPKLEYFKREDSSSKGTVVYDEAEAAAILEKKAAVLKKWKSMNSTVRKALEKDNKSLVQTTIANNMNALKIDMRRLSKVSSGGDILVRGSTEEAAKFDYNSGQFALKPIPAQAESIFNEVNDLYFYVVKESPAVALQTLDKVDAMFNAWFADIDK